MNRKFYQDNNQNPKKDIQLAVMSNADLSMVERNRILCSIDFWLKLGCLTIDDFFFLTISLTVAFF